MGSIRTTNLHTNKEGGKRNKETKQNHEKKTYIHQHKIVFFTPRKGGKNQTQIGKGKNNPQVQALYRGPHPTKT